MNQKVKDILTWNTDDIVGGMFMWILSVMLGGIIVGVIGVAILN